MGDWGAKALPFNNIARGGCKYQYTQNCLLLEYIELGCLCELDVLGGGFYLWHGQRHN